MDQMKLVPATAIDDSQLWNSGPAVKATTSDDAEVTEYLWNCRMQDGMVSNHMNEELLHCFTLEHETGCIGTGRDRSRKNSGPGGTIN
ncbi:hypothetical protein ACA910_011119 [Epithemia clementina (nom. ined.)]